MSATVIRLESNDGAELLDRAGKVPAAFERNSKIVMGRDQVGLERQGGAVRGDGSHEVAFLLPRDTEIIMGDREVRLEAYGFLVFLNRPREVAALLPLDPSVHVGRGVSELGVGEQVWRKYRTQAPDADYHEPGLPHRNNLLMGGV